MELSRGLSFKYLHSTDSVPGTVLGYTVNKTGSLGHGAYSKWGKAGR